MCGKGKGEREKTQDGREVAGFVELEREEKSMGREVVGVYEGIKRHGEGREGASRE